MENTVTINRNQTKKLEPNRLKADAKTDFKIGEFVIYTSPTGIKYSAQVMRFYGYSVEVKIYIPRVRCNDNKIDVVSDCVPLCHLKKMFM